MLIPTIGQAFKSQVGKVHGLHNLDDAHPWVLHDRSLDVRLCHHIFPFHAGYICDFVGLDELEGR